MNLITLILHNKFYKYINSTFFFFHIDLLVSLYQDYYHIGDFKLELINEL